MNMSTLLRPTRRPVWNERVILTEHGLSEADALPDAAHTYLCRECGFPVNHFQCDCSDSTQDAEEMLSDSIPTPKKREGTTRISIYDDALPADWQKDGNYIWLGPRHKGMEAHSLYLTCCAFKLQGDTPGEWLERCYENLGTTCQKFDSFREDIIALWGKTLVCTCTAAMPCHCDVLMALADEEWSGRNKELAVQSGRSKLVMWENTEEMKPVEWDKLPELSLA